MKKFGCIVLCFILMISLVLSLNNSSEEWKIENYIEYVTENIEPFPTVEYSEYVDESLEGAEKFFATCEYIFNLIKYPIDVVFVVVHNAIVIFDGVFPARPSSGSGPGDGFGGGGGGAR